LSGGVSPTYPQLAMLMDSQKVSFNLASAMGIDGPFDEAALRRSLRSLIARHDALRARFVHDGEMVRMHFDEQVPDVLSTLDLPGEDPADPRVMQAVRAEWRTPFALHAGPPVRALLIRQSPVRHVLVLSVHHVVTDEWSANILKCDLARFYRAELGAGQSPPAPLPFRYGDYASWQARLHTTDEFARQLGYWTREFQELQVDGEFPQSAACDPAPACATRFVQLEASAGIAQQLAALRAGFGYTGYVVLMAALQLALARYSGLEQQVVWSPVSRRTQPELEESVGMYTNLVAIAARAAPGITLAEFLALVDRKVSQARSNSDVSALTALMGDPGLMPAMPMIGLNFIELPNESRWDFHGAVVTPIPLLLEEEADLCALELTVRVAEGESEMTVAYNTAMFGDEDVRRISDGLWTMIDHFGKRPHARVAELLMARQDMVQARAGPGPFSCSRARAANIIRWENPCLKPTPYSVRTCSGSTRSCCSWPACRCSTRSTRRQTRSGCRSSRSR